MIDGLQNNLRSFGDNDMMDKARKDPNLMKQLVDRYFHCG